MSDTDIDIKITTTADTSGAEQAKKSIFAIEDAAKQAERELDVLEAKRKQSGGLTGVDLTGNAGGHAEKLLDKLGYKQELEAAKALGKSVGVELTGAAALDAAAIGGAFAAIAASAVVAFKGVSDSLSDYKNLMTRWRELTGKELDQGSQDILAYAKTFSDIEQPIDAAIKNIGGFISSIAEIVQHPLDSLIKLRKELDGTGDLEAAIKRAEDAKKALAGVIQARAEAGQVELASIYGEENEKLKEQEKTLQRIGNLRSTLGNLEAQGARQEVESAKQRGGDVGLAEANVLAVQLRSGLEKLQQDLSETKATADTAQGQANAALVAYNAAIRDKLDPAMITQLGDKVDAAQTATNAANQAAADQEAIFVAAKTNLIRGSENGLAALEQEFDGKTSTAAKQAFDSIYQNLQTSFSEGPREAIKAIKADTAKVTQDATTKAGEVTAAIDQLQTDVVKPFDEAIKGLAKNVERLLQIGTALAGTVSSQADNVETLLQIGADLAGTVSSQADRIHMLDSKVSSIAGRPY